MLFTLYLDKLLKEENNFVQVNAVHPGIVDTNLFNDTLLKRFLPWFIPLIFKVRIKICYLIKGNLLNVIFFITETN